MGIEQLCDACEDGNEEEVRMLLESGEVDVNEIFDDTTPLISATIWNRADIVRILLSYPNTKLDVKDSKGYTCLHWACYHDTAEIVHLLVEDDRCSKDLINMKSEGGDSALIVCVWRASIQALKVMAKVEDSDFGIKDAKGLSLLEVARDKSDTEEVIQFLESL